MISFLVYYIIVMVDITQSTSLIQPDIFVHLQQYGKNSIRVRINRNNEPLESLPGAILPNSLHNPKNITIKYGDSSSQQVLLNGNIKILIGGVNNTITAIRRNDQQTLLSLQMVQAQTTAIEGYYSWELQLQSWKDEHIWGMGEHQTGKLDNKGLKFDFKGEQKKHTYYYSIYCEFSAIWLFL